VLFQLWRESNRTFGEDFIGTATDIVDAVIVVELGKRDFALTGARD